MSYYNNPIQASAGVYPPPPHSYPPPKQEVYPPPPPHSYPPPKQEVYPPPPPVAQGYCQAGAFVAPPPVDHPMRYGPQHHQPPPPAPEKTKQSDRFCSGRVVLPFTAAASWTCGCITWSEQKKGGRN